MTAPDAGPYMNEDGDWWVPVESMGFRDARAAVIGCLHYNVPEDGTLGLREAAMALFDPMTHGSQTHPNEGHTVETLCPECVRVRSGRYVAIRRALQAQGAMPTIGFRAAPRSEDASPQPDPEFGGGLATAHPSPADAPHRHVWVTTFGTGPDWQEHCATCPATRDVLAKEPTDD